MLCVKKDVSDWISNRNIRREIFEHCIVQFDWVVLPLWHSCLEISTFDFETRTRWCEAMNWQLCGWMSAARPSNSWLAVTVDDSYYKSVGSCVLYRRSNDVDLTFVLMCTRLWYCELKQHAFASYTAALRLIATSVSAYVLHCTQPQPNTAAVSEKKEWQNSDWVSLGNCRPCVRSTSIAPCDVDTRWSEAAVSMSRPAHCSGGRRVATPLLVQAARSIDRRGSAVERQYLGLHKTKPDDVIIEILADYSSHTLPSAYCYNFFVALCVCIARTVL